MLNVSGSKFVHVFEVEEKEKYITCNLSTSKKNTINGEVSYENMSWKGKFVGDAYKKAKGVLVNGNSIDILAGCITNRYDKEKKVLYVDVTIFDYENSKKSNNN